MYVVNHMTGYLSHGSNDGIWPNRALLNSFIPESPINISYINSLHITSTVSNYPHRSLVIKACKRTQSSALNTHLSNGLCSYEKQTVQATCR
jgi:hypothetical protein